MGAPRPLPSCGQPIASLQQHRPATVRATGGQGPDGGSIATKWNGQGVSRPISSPSGLSGRIGRTTGASISGGPSATYLHGQAKTARQDT
jgi:hypothetical protein